MPVPGDRARARGRRELIALSALLAAAANACVGVIFTPPPPGTSDGGTTIGDGAAPPDARPPGDGGGPIESCAMPGEPAPPFMRRLTNAEYNRTVRALTGETADVTDEFPADPFIGGFDNNAEGLIISTAHAERFRDAAERVAQGVLAAPARRTLVVGCDLAPTASRATCTRTFVQRFGRLAFRRALAAEEVTAYTALAARRATDAEPYAGASLVIQAMLQSPNFLYRVEVGEPDPARPALRRLRGTEVATRLSFLLTGAAPGDALITAGESGQLDTAEGVAATARALLADPTAARAAVRTFYSQWLRLYELDDVDPDLAVYPAWSEALRTAMRGETERLLDDHIWREGANFLDVFTARHSFLTAPLASLYGVAAPATPWARVEFAEADERGGLLTLASLMALTARIPGAEPIHRGKYVREVIQCRELPAPPPDVPDLPPPMAGESDRERLARHRTDPACRGCHHLLDPVGFGFERYNGIGALRRTDASGRALTAEGQLVEATPPDFRGARELATRLRNSPEIPQCVVHQAMRYAFGRLEQPGDVCTAAEIERRFRDANYSFREMFVALVQTDAFRYVRVGAPGGGM